MTSLIIDGLQIDFSDSANLDLVTATQAKTYRLLVALAAFDRPVTSKLVLEILGLTRLEPLYSRLDNLRKAGALQFERVKELVTQ
jgi:hypothetical protein